MRFITFFQLKIMSLKELFKHLFYLFRLSVQSFHLTSVILLQQTVSSERKTAMNFYSCRLPKVLFLFFNINNLYQRNRCLVSVYQQNIAKQNTVKLCCFNFSPPLVLMKCFTLTNRWTNIQRLQIQVL